MTEDQQLISNLRKAISKRYGLSGHKANKLIMIAFGVSASTMSSWTSGARKPGPTTRRFADFVIREPQCLLCMPDCVRYLLAQGKIELSTDQVLAIASQAIQKDMPNDVVN